MAHLYHVSGDIEGKLDVLLDEETEKWGKVVEFSGAKVGRRST